MACFLCGRGLPGCNCQDDSPITMAAEAASEFFENSETAQAIAATGAIKPESRKGPGRPPKPDDEIGSSAGRKRAGKAIEEKLRNKGICDWAGLANCGGGKHPIVGCINGIAKHVHHGPDKDTSNNDPLNLHNIDESCVSYDTMILKSDLTWIRADQIRVGDSLIGFDEDFKLNPKLKYSTVESISYPVKPGYNISLEDGTDLTCSYDHQWVMSTKNMHLEWRETQYLKPGHTLRLVVYPWEINTSWEAGWFAGFLDGEGCLTKYHLSASQKEDNLIVDKMERAFRNIAQGTVAAVYRDPAADNHQYTRIVRVANLQDILTILGTIRPERLLSYAEKSWLGRSPFHANKNNRIAVTEIYPIGDINVVSIQTSTKTFIADGFASHNCHNR